MRDPAVHILSSDLRRILKGTDVEYSDKEWRKLMVMFRGVALNRSLYSMPKADKNKIEKLNSVTADKVETFISLLASVRQRIGHKHIKPIKKGDKDYTTATEVAGKAYDFAESFYPDNHHAGVIAFIDQCIKSMGRNYGLNRFKNAGDSLWKRNEMLEIIKDREDQTGPEEVKLLYCRELVRYGVVLPEQETDDVTFNFHCVNTWDQMQDCGVKQTKVWIKAQFEGMAFMDIIPQVYQLYGEGAYKRYAQHLVNIGGGDPPRKNESKTTSYFEKLKSLAK